MKAGRLNLIFDSNKTGLTIADQGYNLPQS